MDQPIRRRIGKIGTDDPQGFSCDKPGLPEQSRSLRRRQCTRWNGGRNLSAPKNLVRHPVPDSNKPTLQQQDRLDRRPRVTSEERVHKRAIKFVGGDVGSSRSPPGRLGPALMKSHSSKQPRIAQSKGLPSLLQDKVIVFLLAKPGWFRPQFSAHPEMDPKPIPAGKFEEHLLATSKGTQETLAG
jgi:hypothetical protein